MPAAADNKKKYVANSSPARHQTVRDQGGSREEGHIHLTDRTLSAAAAKKKKREREKKYCAKADSSAILRCFFFPRITKQTLVRHQEAALFVISHHRQLPVFRQ